MDKPPPKILCENECMKTEFEQIIDAQARIIEKCEKALKRIYEEKEHVAPSYRALAFGIIYSIARERIAALREARK